LLSGWGIRTVSTAERAATIRCRITTAQSWPHDNALIALGLSLSRQGRCGAHLPRPIRYRHLFRAASIAGIVLRLPSLRQPQAALYPVACARKPGPAGSFFALYQASLGIKRDPWKKEIRFQSPTLPNFLDEVELKGLAAGSGSVDVLVRRHVTEPR
jgi:glycogen debranching enzyme